MTTPSRRSGLFRLLAGLAAMLIMALGMSVAIAIRGGGTAPTARAAETPAVEIHAAHGTSYLPALEGKRPLFILALGSDARPGEEITRLRSDSIHLIGVNLVTKHATILGFPRDSWVNIPGHGTTKINEAMVDGGPDLMVHTIESLTGVHIDFWLLTSFQGLIAMVDQIGGLSVDVPYAMHDSYSGANFRAGKQHLNGGQALAFARNRHDTPNGDFSRSGNQGILLNSGLAELRQDFDTRPSLLFTYLAALWRNVHTDLPLSTLLDLALTATQVSPSHVNNLVVPGTAGMAGSASVVYISPSASSIYADLRDDGVVE
jgi:LCP family protein required for cell wall assembly